MARNRAVQTLLDLRRPVIWLTETPVTSATISRICDGGIPRWMVVDLGVLVIWLGMIPNQK